MCVQWRGQTKGGEESVEKDIYPHGQKRGKLVGARRVDGRVVFGPWKIEGLKKLVFRCSKKVIFNINILITPLLWGSKMLSQFPL